MHLLYIKFSSSQTIKPKHNFYKLSLYPFFTNQGYVKRYCKILMAPTYLMLRRLTVITECEPVVFVDFTGQSIINKSPRRIWIDPTDTQITRSAKGAQYGRFNGFTSRISIPFLSGRTIETLLARLRFFTSGTSGPESQVLFSNCETETVRWNSPDINKDLSPSIAIILNRKMNRLVFLGSTEDRASEQVMMLLPFKVIFDHIL